MLSARARVLWNMDTSAVRNVESHCEFSRKNDAVKQKNWSSDLEKRRAFRFKMLV